MATLLCATALPSLVFAHGELWYDVTAHVPQFKKIVIYPVEWPDHRNWVSSDENTVVYKINDYFDKKFVRRLKFRTISLGRTLKENKELRTDEEKYNSLYNNYPTEEARGKAVFDITGADGYLVPITRECRTETYMSPQKTVSVAMSSWTEVTNSPRGNYTTDKRNWTVQHVIPAKERTLYHMEIEHMLFDRDGKKIMTYRNRFHNHDYKIKNYEEKMTKDLIDEFREDVKDIKEDFEKEKQKGRLGPRIGFRDISLPSNIAGNEAVLKSIYFGMKDGARRWTDAKLNYRPEDAAYEKYYVKGSIGQYSLDRIWHDPYVTTWNKMVSRDEQKWVDGAGNEHTQVTSRYETDITDHYGGYEYVATVSGSFFLADANTGQILVEHSATETDDKTADAYRHLMKSFYEKASKYLKK